MTDAQVETILRQAPQPAPPAALRQQLQAAIRLEPAAPRESPSPLLARPLWKRWVPALAFGLLFLGCFIVLALQTSQWLELRRQHDELRAAAATVDLLQQENDRLRREQIPLPSPSTARTGQQELQSLRAEASQLRPLTQQLATLRAEQQRLQAGAGDGTQQTVDPFAAQKERAQSIACINNLKQLGLAARLWSNDHNTNILPTDLLLIRQELNTPRVLTCPAEAGKTRTPSPSWEQFDPNSVSYELPSRHPSEFEPYTVYSRCPMHGHIGLTDGSAISGDQKPYTVMEDGNLMLRRRPENNPNP
ncbi:MAG TPA: hypothetical protein VNU68_09605 [Verrucomicrobiae bacterium]|nr:hypothetical protein [Verrucomicrobiae bacterium]